MFDTGIFNGLSVEELETAKEALVNTLKAKKEANKEAEKASKAKVEAERAATAKASVEEGRIARFIYKGEEVEAIVEKKGDKTITVELPEGKRYIKYEKVVG